MAEYVPTIGVLAVLLVLLVLFYFIRKLDINILKQRCRRIDEEGTPMAAVSHVKLPFDISNDTEGKGRIAFNFRSR